jgi:hypothetical protein
VEGSGSGSNTGVVGSNHTRGMDVCVHSAFVLSCAQVTALRRRALKDTFPVFHYWKKIDANAATNSRR